MQRKAVGRAKGSTNWHGSLLRRTLDTASSEEIILSEGFSNATLLINRIFNGTNGSSHMDTMALPQRTSNGAPMALSSGKG